MFAWTDAPLPAQTLIAFECRQTSEAQEVAQGFEIPSRLQTAYRKGVAQHRGTHGLFGNPCSLGEPIKQQRDGIGHQRLIRLGEEEGILLNRFFCRTLLWTVPLQIGEQLVPAIW